VGTCVPAKDILIVDDEAGICELLAGALEDVGYAVDVAATADEARSLLHEHRYGMVVVDWRLPDDRQPCGGSRLPRIRHERLSTEDAGRQH
jgi:DNA-binding response OmpR family regulator